MARTPAPPAKTIRARLPQGGGSKAMKSPSRITYMLKKRETACQRDVGRRAKNRRRGKRTPEIKIENQEKKRKRKVEAAGGSKESHHNNYSTIVL